MATGNNATIAKDRFLEYLRIPSVHPHPDYQPIIAFIKRYADELGLTFETYEITPSKPIAILTWPGSDPNLKTVVLNGHTDVVPVEKDKWSSDPFAAEIRDNKVYARGSQDMKCVNIQYMEAIRRLKQKGASFKRTVHVLFMPEEEIGGILGAKPFVEQKPFLALNSGVVLDEGLACPGDEFYVYNRERTVWWLELTCRGQPGHGSRLLEDTAAEKFRYVQNKLLAIRDAEVQRLELFRGIDNGDVISVNMTILSAGQQTNVVPSTVTANFDIRIPSDVRLDVLENKLKQWVAEAGKDITMNWLQRGMSQCVSPVDENASFWQAMKKGLAKHGTPVSVRSFVGGTDARYFREKGIPAYGFSPMNNTPILLHDHNEFLDLGIFERGITIYEDIIANLAQVE